MSIDELISNYPRLWHMAEDGSWPSIKDHGLLSTSSLLDLHGISGNERRAIESQRRPDLVSLSTNGVGSTVIRDNKPMSDAALNGCLTDGLTPEQWYTTLNGMIFFWLSKDRVHRLLGARAYRNRPHIVITVETASLVEAHLDNVRLSPINSGSTIMKPQPRGRNTFLPISAYPFETWRRQRGKRDAVVELTVIGGVPDIVRHALTVQRVDGGSVRTIWRAKNASGSEGI